MILSTPKREDPADSVEERHELEDASMFSSEVDHSESKNPNLPENEPTEEGPEPISHQSIQLSSHSSWLRQVQKAVRKTCDFFFDTQHPKGYWWSELESNVTITSEYIMLLYLLGIRDEQRQRSMVRYLLNMQSENGSWALYYGDEGNLSITVEAYFALKLAGEDPESEPLRKAREYILKNGGVEEARVFTKIWLALFSQYDWNKVPSMPVELVLLPPEFYFNIYEFSSWARGTIVPLSIVMAIRPRLTLPPAKEIPEVYLDGNRGHFQQGRASYIHKLFYLIDRTVKWFERRPLPSFRNRAVHAAETWILEHQEDSGDWGGIQPPMVYSMLALHYLGYPLDHDVMVKGQRALENFCLEDDLGMRMQSCVSPVWDTALTSLALLDGGIPADHPNLQKVASWLIRNQVVTGGDWQVKNCCPPGGWAFEFVNNQYPDVDDSAVVLMALHRLDAGENQCQAMDCAKSRGMEWSLSMQSSDGGWAAFDKDNNMLVLNRIPFADQEAMVDYTSADVTGRVLEAMGYFGYPRSHPKARRAIRFLRDIQEPDGSWWGRWGVNYIYGTWSVLKGLVSIGEDPKAPYIQAAIRWIKDHQNPDGGWGETCESYKNPELRGQGPSTASQTAWALMALFCCGEEQSSQAHRGVQYLLRNQKPDGSWDEEYFTGTGFPNHFYIRYHNYRNCFPLMALGQYVKSLLKRERAQGPA
jgi:squalene-hopene/tetraprenyl-beta-curcumene cyclase